MADSVTRGMEQQTEVALMKGVQQGQADVVKLLLQTRVSADAVGSEHSLLHQAFQNGHADVVELLLQSRVSVDAVGLEHSVLHQA
eukprot:8996503-Karenia_brevis.AAC.1